MSSKKKTVQDTTTHQVVTPNNPTYVDKGLEGLTGQITGLSSADPASFVAGPDALQTQAAQAAAGLSSSPNYDAATSMVTGAGRATTPASLLDNLQAYMSPYTNDVVDKSLADYDYGAGQAVAQNQLALAGDMTFGGSGGSIQTALSNDALTRGRGTLSAGLRDQAFNTGASLSNLDAQRRQQANDSSQQRALSAGLGLADIGSAQGNDERSNIGAQATIGQILQQLAQQKAAAPLNLLNTQAGLMGSLPLGLVHGQTTDGTEHTKSTTSSSNPMGAIGSLAMGLGALGFAPLTGGLSLGALGGLGGLGSIGAGLSAASGIGQGIAAAGIR